jgi:HEAT repeat protein
LSPGYYDEQDPPQDPISGVPDSGGEPVNNEVPDQISRDISPGQNERLVHFIQLLTDDNEDSRWKAAESLGKMGDPDAVDPLIETLWDDDARVRLKAAWALGRIGDPRALRPLQRLYRMENEWAQEIIGQALEEIKERMSHS